MKKWTLRKILVADSSKEDRDIIKNTFNDSFEVLETINGKDAFRIIQQNHKILAAIILDLAIPVMDGFEILSRIQQSAVLSQIPVIVTTSNSDRDEEICALSLGASDFIAKPYDTEILKHRLKNMIRLHDNSSFASMRRKDELTGILNQKAFFETSEKMIMAESPGHYVMASFDIDDFKVINDRYGNAIGNEVLKRVARIFDSGFAPLGGICSRITSDKFAVLYPRSFVDSDELAEIRRQASLPDGDPIPITFSIGRYIVDDLNIPVSGMYDRAVMAQSAAEGHFDYNILTFNESMRKQLLQEQQVTSEMKAALEEEQFEVWLQPQYNHATDALIGAEALVRWRHPIKGIIFPNEFVPLFERNGFIYELDKYVWRQVCALLRKWIDEGRTPLPVSVNVSRYDVLREDFITVITGLVHEYDIPIELLRLEITESAFSKSTEQIISVVKKLIAHGFMVEIDDFGSGYSSLNTLKDVPAQVLKLDMRFLESSGSNDRGGNVLESVIRMAKWLDMAVIAEGVETKSQANYLRSIGCVYIQGFLYAKPMPAGEYEQLTLYSNREEELLALDTVKNLDNNEFWDPDSMDTLIFNSYVGAACIMEYHSGHVELLRVSDMFMNVLGSSSMTSKDVFKLDWNGHLAEESLTAMEAAIQKSIESASNVSGEYLFLNIPGCPEKTYLRITLRVIANIGNLHLIYCLNENITVQKELEERERASAVQLQAIMDNINGGVAAAVIRGGEPDILFANEQYYEQLGYTKEQYEAEITEPRNLIHSGDRDRFLRTVSTSTTPFSIVYRINRRDGTVRWLQNNIAIVHLPGLDEPVQLSVANDITEMVKSQQQVSKLSEWMQTMMNDMPGGFARLRVLPGGTVATEYVNDNFCRLRGLTREEIMSADKHDATDTIHPDDLDMVLQTVRDMVATGETRNITYRLKHADGSYIRCSVFGRITSDDAGEKYINAYYGEIT